LPGIEDARGSLRAKLQGRLVPALALVAVGASLAYRATQRGLYYPGWDILGAAQGLQVLSTSPPGEALARLVRGVSHFRYWNSTDSLLYTLVPGALGRLRPYEFWSHWLTLALVGLSLGLIARFASLALRDAWVVALAWGASAALLSFSIAGYPYATGFLPHALALVIVASPWLRARPLVSLVAALAATELSWHVYEAGKTLVVVFVLGAVLERNAPLATRAGWLLASGVQIARVFSHRGFNVDYVIRGADLGPRALALAAGRTLEALAGRVDLPLVVPLGLLALFFVRRHRWLLLGGVLSQVGTVVLAAAADPTAIRPRRLLTTSFYCLTALAVFFAQSKAVADGRRLLRLAFVTALSAGCFWQLADTWLFFRVAPAGRSEPLPFTFSSDDYRVSAGATDAAGWIRAEMERGRRVVVLSNLNSETIVDPEALLERVYLTTGHERFRRQVLVFGHRRCRYDCLPIRPLGAVDGDVAALAAGGGSPVALYRKALEPRRHLEESKIVLAALRRDFALRPGGEPAAGFGSLELLPRSGTAPGIVVEAATEPLPLDLAWLPRPREPGKLVLTSPRGGRAFRHEWSGVAVAGEDTVVDLLLGCDGRLRLEVDGQPRVERSVAGFTIWRESLQLARGRHALRLAYETRSGAGRLLLQLEAPLGE
jgi:hypothetical protein